MPSEECAVRLWATIGYGAMVLLAAAFFRRVFSATYALAATFLTCLCTFDWAYEGRAYGLVIGFAGCALYSWRLMTENRHAAWPRAFFVLSAATMTALHFQAVFFFGPLLMADLYRSFRGGRMNWKIWTVTALVIVSVLVIHYPIIAGYQKFYAYCWAPALWKYFPAILPLNITAKYVYESAVALFIVAIILYRHRFVEMAKGLLDEYVWIAFLLYYVSPVVIFMLSVYTTHVFLSRYTVWMFIGAGGLAVGLFALASKASERIGVILSASLMVAVVFISIQKVVEKDPFIGIDQAIKEAMSLPQDTTPIVVAHHHVFMGLYHYAPPQIRHRLIYSLSREQDIRYLGYDSGALLMEAIRKRYQLPIKDYNEILSHYDRFYVLAVPGHYLPSVMQKDGRRMRVLQTDTYSVLYLTSVDKSHSNR